jgi:hypothetical protein
MTDAVGSSDFDPVIQSALGILRESAGPLVHIAELGVALVVAFVLDSRSPRPKSGQIQIGPAARDGANVIPFPQLKTPSRRLEPGRKRS